MKSILIIILAITTYPSFSQTDTSQIITDTVLLKLIKDLPKEVQDEFIKDYKKQSPEERKAMAELTKGLKEVFSKMPKSSKRELIQNVDTNYRNIIALKNYFLKIVPISYAVYIEFKPAEKLMNKDESIDFWAYRRNSKTKLETIFQEWSVELKSAKLDNLLKQTTLTRNDLQVLKSYLDKAHCISVSNRDQFEVGFARSGMGKYSYLILDKPLTIAEKKKYNNGCEYIFYKDNIVLEYGGGAVGSQCFPDDQ